MNWVIHNSNGYVIVCVAWHTHSPLKMDQIVHYGLWFLTKLYACLKSHSFYMTQPFTFLPSIFLITTVGWYNLWSYTSCSFLQYPTTFSHKILRTDQLCSPAHSTVFPECHNPSVTPTFMKILHTHMYIFQQPCFQRAGKESKTLEGCSSKH